MNVVIPYIHTHDSGMELRYTLRSLKNIINFDGDVYIIGDRERWFTDKVVHIPYKRMYGKPYLDQIQKMWVACIQEDIGDEFIAMMDDIYCLEPTKVGVYYVNDQLKSARPSFHQRTKEQTAAKLHSMGLPTKDYESHAPMVVNREKLLATLNFMLKLMNTHTLQWRSMYGNMHGIDAELFTDAKTKTSVLPEGNIISTNGYTKELERLFPESSVYEW